LGPSPHQVTAESNRAIEAWATKGKEARRGAWRSEPGAVADRRLHGAIATYTENAGWPGVVFKRNIVGGVASTHSGRATNIVCCPALSPAWSRKRAHKPLTAASKIAAALRLNKQRTSTSFIMRGEHPCDAAEYPSWRPDRIISGHFYNENYLVRGRGPDDPGWCDPHDRRVHGCRNS